MEASLVADYLCLGGMIVPATLYLVFNSGTQTSHGWGIPMATDIAFSLGVLSGSN